MLSEHQLHQTCKVLGLAAMSAVGGDYTINWATALVAEGIESDAVMILAGMSPTANAFEIEELFNRALSELSIQRPSSTEALWGYAKAIAKEVLNGALAAEEGASMIYEVSVHLDYPEQLDDLTALKDEWLCTHIKGWSLERRREEVIKASERLMRLIESP